MKILLAALLTALLLGCVSDDWVSYEECVLKNYELAVNTHIPEHRDFYLRRADYCLQMAQVYAGQRAALQAAIAGAAAQSYLEQQGRPQPAPARQSRICTVHGQLVLCP